MKRSAATLLAVTLAACGTSSETSDFEIKSIGEDVYTLVGSTAQPASAWTAAAEKQCEGKQICSAFGWADPANAATGMPMLDREAKAMVFHYVLNRNANFERSLFRCPTFKGMPPGQCLATE